MDISVLQLLLGTCIGIPVSGVVNLVSAQIFKNISQQDLYELFIKCLAESIKENQNILKPYVVRPGPDPYLDTKRLTALLEQDEFITPAVIPRTVEDSNEWMEYFAPFKQVIVIPGLNPDDPIYLRLIDSVLTRASELFNQEVPSSHPAFEQVVLSYHRSHTDDLQDIKDSINLLPQRTAVELNRSARQEGEPASLELSHLAIISNPFSVVAADDLDLSDPEDVRQIRNLFISRYTDLQEIRKHFNTLLEGQRGTGKTMIMKFLAFETQVLEWTEEHGSNARDMLSHPQNFIGVYSKLSQGVYDKSDFEAVSSDVRREQIFEHRLVLQLIYDVLQTMRSVYQFVDISPNHMKQIARALKAFLYCDELQHCNTITQLIEEAQFQIDIELVPDVDKHLRSVVPGSMGGPTNFDPWLTLSTQFMSLLKLLRRSVSATVPFFLMLDDFDVLEDYQQGSIFKAASQRDTSNVCFKIGLMVLGQKINTSGPERTFRTSDDYDLVDLDWTSGGLHENYRRAILEISHARLKAANWPLELEALLPIWSRGDEIKNEVFGEMDREWENAQDKPTVSRSDYTSKYGNSRYFQTLRSRKIRHRYAGFDEVTMVSSGIFRQFLEICNLIFNRALDQGWAPPEGGVRPEIQDWAIRDYSEDMIQQFTRTSGDSQALLSGDTDVTSQHMVSLIESLCDVFYARLHTHPPSLTPYHDGEIICVAINNLNPNSQPDTFLKIAVRESILHRFTYPPKTAGGPNLPAFMLNRRLGPRRDLSIARMQGRIEVRAEDILLAVNDRKSFLRRLRPRRPSRGTSESQMPLLVDPNEPHDMETKT